MQSEEDSPERIIPQEHVEEMQSGGPRVSVMRETFSAEEGIARH